MRILFAVHGYPPECTGGTELYVRKLSQGLAARGHTLSVVAGSLQWFHQDRTSEETLDNIQVSRIHRSDPFHERWEKSYCPTAGLIFDKILAKFKPDLLHVHHWMRLSRDLVEIARRRKIPAVVTIHDLWSTCLRVDRILDGEGFCSRTLDPKHCVPCIGGARPWTGVGELREAGRLYLEDIRNELAVARARIVPTKIHAERVASALELDPSSFTILPHGSISDLKAGKKRRPLADGMLRIGHWGALYHLKGVHVLLEAAHLSRYKDKLDIHLYGSAPDDAYGDKLRQLAEGLRVEFHGPFRAPDLGRETFDIVVMPSLASESYSFALDEAISLGFPIFASDFGALSERLGSAGKLFPRGDRTALAAMLDECIEKPQSLQKFEARTPPMTIEEHVTRMEKIYKEADASGKVPANSKFDDRAHVAFEFQRSENRLRHALRLESLTHFVRDIQDDRENRIKMIEFLQAERERLEKRNIELARRVAETEQKLASRDNKADIQRTAMSNEKKPSIEKNGNANS
ncbi:MAG: glycosyltransferase [Planctomycetes bacterium]|nr:glycosyltransferase [Planctomycetota bacterium]